MANRKYSEKSAETRADFENKENLPTEAVDAPAERFQDTQQVNSAINQGDNATPDTTYQKKKVRAQGAQLKQNVAAEVITGKGGAGSYRDVMSPVALQLKTMSYSGDTSGLLGDMSGTPVLGKDAQGKTRFEKRNSDANKQINYIASEQVVVEYDNIPALAESKSTVGYNGTPKPAAARSQKTTGVTPADLLYDRSLDEIRRDEFVFTVGQTIKTAGVKYYDYPTVTTTIDADGVISDDTKFSIERGNYSPRSLEIKFDKDGGGAYLSSFEVKTDDFSINAASADVVDCSAMNQQIAVNQSELARQRIDAEAGSPTSAKFNPLGRSVAQPSQTVCYLRDMEQVTGAEVFAAYRFAQKARAYYLNRTAKDGQDIVGPAIDALYGHLTGAVDQAQLNAVFKPDDRAAFIDVAGLKAGSAAILLSAFDSPSKYKTKADLVNQPRGLKLHLQTADNNMNPFRVNPNFVKAMDCADVFSTIDRAYDPMSAVCVTDNVRLVHPYDWNKMLKFTRAASGAGRQYAADDQVLTYRYAAGSGQNMYFVTCGEPVLNGVAYLLERMAASFYNALGGKSGEVTMSIPIVHSTCHFSLWDYLVCAATPYILYERTNTFKDVLDFETFVAYPFPELVKLSDVNPLTSSNYTLSGSESPLVAGQMKPVSALRWTWGETFSPAGEAVILPWYFSEDGFEFSASTAESGAKTTIQNSVNRAFSTPVIRSGVRLDIVDDAAGFEPEALLLAQDCITHFTPLDNEDVHGGVYKYSASSEGIPYVLLSNFKKLGLTYATMHKQPRMTGWLMPAYPGEACVYATKAPNAYGVLCDGTQAFEPTESSSMRARQYTGAYTTFPTALLSKASRAVSRAQAFAQKWGEMRASGVFLNNCSANTDIGLSVNKYLSGSTASMKAITNQTAFLPFSGEANVPILAMHKMWWTRISKLPVVINPFDLAFGGMVDPFDLAYAFNLAGFMAADFNEMEYNRQNAYQNQGYGFTKDPYMDASPIFS